MSRKDCPLCRAGQLGVEWTKAFLRGQKTIQDIAHEFNMTPEAVSDHIMNHDMEKMLKDRKKNLDKIFGRGEISDKFKQLYGLLNDLVAHMTTKTDLDARDISALTKAIAEMRRLIMDAATLDGMVTQKTEVTFAEDFDTVIEIINTELCDECKRRVLKKLDVIQ